jgi:hypothetical protein
MAKTLKKRKHIPLSHFISDAHMLLNNSLSPAILPLMVARGYTQADIEARLAEVEHLQSLHFAMSTQHGSRMSAKEAYKAARAIVNDAYTEQVQIARIAFKDDVGAQVALELAGRRSQRRGAYVLQGMAFCNNLLATDDWKAAMAARGVAEADIQALLQGFENLRMMVHALEGKGGEALASTQARNAVYYTLRPWISDYRKVARIALRKHPQMCEQLGLKQKS